MLFIHTWKIIWRKVLGLLYLNELLELAYKFQKARSAKALLSTYTSFLHWLKSEWVAEKKEKRPKKGLLQSLFMALNCTLATIHFNQGEFGVCCQCRCSLTPQHSLGKGMLTSLPSCWWSNSYEVTLIHSKATVHSSAQASQEPNSFLRGLEKH